MPLTQPDIPVDEANLGPIWIARQPILDRQQRRFGYELLFREAKSGTEKSPTTDDDGLSQDNASARLILHSVIDIGIKKLVGDSYAFINFTRALLLNYSNPLFRNSQVILQIIKDVIIDDALIAAARTLAAQGFQIALDEFNFRRDAVETEGLLQIARFVKLNVRGFDRNELELMVKRLRQYPVKLIAGKIETREEYQQCFDMGFDYFQGPYLYRPQIVSGSTPTANKLFALQLVAATEKESNGPAELEAIIRKDASLSYKLLRCVNSAYFALPVKVKSILHATIYVGVGRIRNWARLLALAGMNDQPAELLKTALIRARMCEQLTVKLSKEKQEMAFMIGLFSLLDALLSTSMEVALDSLPLVPEVRLAIVNHEGPLAEILDNVMACENGDWDYLESKGISTELYSSAYLDAVDWAEEAYRMANTEAA